MKSKRLKIYIFILLVIILITVFHKPISAFFNNEFAKYRIRQWNPDLDLSKCGKVIDGFKHFCDELDGHVSIGYEKIVEEFYPDGTLKNRKTSGTTRDMFYGNSVERLHPSTRSTSLGVSDEGYK